MSSPHASSENIAKDYGDLLSQLPVFEPYNPRNDTLSEVSDVGLLNRRSGSWRVSSSKSQLSNRHRRTGSLEYGTSGYVYDPSAKSKKSPQSGAGQLESSQGVDAAGSEGISINAEVQLEWLSKLRQIERRRDRLLRAQLKVETTERQLATARADLKRNIRNSVSTSRNSDLSDADARTRLASLSAKLLNKITALDAVEKELQLQQRQVTLKQTEFRTATDDLFAILAAGARLGDSEASVEDRQYEDVASVSASPPSQQRLSTISESQRELSVVSPADQPAIEQSRLSEIQSLGYHSELPTTGVSRILEMGPGSNDVEIHQRRPHRRPGRAAIAEVPAFGAQFNRSDVDEATMKAESNRWLRPSESVRLIRSKDLGPEMSTSELVYAKNIQSARIRRGIAAKFAEINVATFHLKDWLSMWGSSMSQNSWTDFWATVRYDTPEASERRLPLCDLVAPLEDKEFDEYAVAATDFLRQLDVHSYLKSLPRLSDIAKRSASVVVQRHETSKTASLIESFNTNRHLASPSSSPRNQSRHHVLSRIASSRSEVRLENVPGQSLNRIDSLQDEENSESEGGLAFARKGLSVPPSTDADKRRPLTNAEKVSHEVCQD